MPPFTLGVAAQLPKKPSRFRPIPKDPSGSGLPQKPLHAGAHLDAERGSVLDAYRQRRSVKTAKGLILGHPEEDKLRRA